MLPDVVDGGAAIGGGAATAVAGKRRTFDHTAFMAPFKTLTWGPGVSRPCAAAGGDAVATAVHGASSIVAASEVVVTIDATAAGVAVACLYACICA